MANSFIAGLRYFAIVFAVAFGLGTLRTLVVAPHTGALIAVCIELPLVLAVAWIVCRRVAADVPSRVAARLVMGGTAFALLMATEVMMTLWLFGRSPAEWLAGLATLAGAIGLAGQIGFGLMPVMLIHDAHRGAQRHR